METPEVAEFRRCILDASWDSAEAALMRLGVTEGEGLWVSVVITGPEMITSRDGHVTWLGLNTVWYARTHVSDATNQQNTR